MWKEVEESCYSHPIHDICCNEEVMGIALGRLTCNYWDGEVKWILGEKQLSLSYLTGISSLAFVSSQLLIAGSYDGSLYSIKEGESSELNDKKHPAHHSPVLKVRSSKKNQEKILSSSMDGQIKLWNVESTLSEVISFDKRNRAITDIAWNQYSDNSFTSVGEDCDIIVWDTRSFEPSIIEKESICPLSISYNPLKEFEFVIGKEDGSIVIKDERKLNESIYTASLHQDAIYSVSWTTNDYICSGGDDGVLSICDNSL